VRLLLAASLLVAPQLAYAECADLTALNEGQAAPCDGVHVKSAAVAKIIVDLEAANQACNNRVEEQKQKSDTSCQGDLAKKDNHMVTLQNVHNLEKDVRKAQINFLVDQLDKAQKPGWYFIVGAVSGIAVTMASAWALNQIK